MKLFLVDFKFLKHNIVRNESKYYVASSFEEAHKQSLNHCYENDILEMNIKTISDEEHLIIDKRS